MGLFGRKKSDEERVEDAMRTAEKIGQGRGLTGGLARLVMGSENTDKVRDAMQAARAGQAGMAGMAGAPAGTDVRTAAVTAIADTGQSVNGNPIVQLELDLEGQAVTLRTMVSRLQIPRAGDTVHVMRNPVDGALLYGGPAS
ncbi:hypothetical protein AAG589_04750 [Isoptericola sp. F-RaC21]|uniref:hypothetical protein n=1 Tax=Isoptericola sp. F-RaC21 TaxID=3141452 RepID=UPI00315B9D1E